MIRRSHYLDKIKPWMGKPVVKAITGLRFQYIAQIIKKIQIWGLKGVVDFFLGKISNYILAHRFEKMLKKHPYINPERGITIIGTFRETFSLSKTMRDFIFSLKEAGISYQTYDLSTKDRSCSKELVDVLTPKKDFNIGKYSHIVDMFNSPLPKVLLPYVSRIVFWEFDSGLIESFPRLSDVKNIIAMSDYNYEYFQKAFSADIKVSKILYPLRIEKCALEDRTETRKRYGMSDDDFVVFFNFAYGSSFHRKNPDGAMKAFAKALADKPDAKLVYKTNNKNEFPHRHSELLGLAKELGISERFITIDDYMGQRDIFSITNACDVYLSLHRGEGFGLGVAEAMSLGKTVIVTDYSSTTEFCKKETAIPIPCKYVTVKKGTFDHPCYYHVTGYVDPDIDSAAEAVKRCYEDREFCKQIGENAQKFIQEHFSLDNFRKSVNNFLD